MARIYFKQHLEDNEWEWTLYGSYCEDEITPEGDVRCSVHDVTREYDADHLKFYLYKMYIDPSEVTVITKEEFESVVAKIKTAEDSWTKADEILKSLL